MSFETLDIIVRITLPLAIIICIILSIRQDRKLKAAKDKILWNKLLNHCGHNVEIVYYGQKGNIESVCLECNDCNEVIIDAEIYTLQERTDFDEDRYYEEVNREENEDE